MREVSAHGHPPPQQRVALFGGSFDPPHRGHLAIARAAVKAAALDSVLFTPTGLQPLKPHGASASYADRFAMVSLVCAPEPRFAVSDLDAPRADGQPNYTVHTLEALRRRIPEARLFAIAGADSFRELPRWYRSERLLELAEWIVVSRPGFPVDTGPPPEYGEIPHTRVYAVNDVWEGISATALREKLAQGIDCSDLVLPSVLTYVHEHHLYRRQSS